MKCSDFITKKRINWYDRDGKLIRIGQYEDIEFESEGLRPEEVELAAKISSEIPTPFLRIDFMRAENDDLVFVSSRRVRKTSRSTTPPSIS